MTREHWCLKTRHLSLIFVVILPIFLFACTGNNAEVPVVLELRAIPASITIGERFYYPKPFSIRAKYSNNTEKNISSRISWVSENILLIDVNKKGEIVKTGECVQKKCVVSLIATDPESGKSLRLTVNIRQKKSLPKKDELEQDFSPESDGAGEDIDDVSQDDEAVSSSKGSMADKQVAASPIVGALEVFESTEEAVNALNEPEVSIRQLGFEENDISLVSGEDYVPRIIAIDADGQHHSNNSRAVACYVPDKVSLTIAILPGCHLLAAKPGSAVVALKLLGDQSVLPAAEELRVQVLPRRLASFSDQVSTGVFIAANQLAQWFQVTGVQASAYYRVILSGDLPLGYRLSVFNRAAIIYPVCVNEVPMNAASVACYFRALDDNVSIAIENLATKPARFSLNLAPAENELFFNKMLINQQAPSVLGFGLPVSAFIFANKLGVNNQHYYVFENDDLVMEDLQIRLYGYSAKIKLEVTWANGFCTEKMMTYKNRETICRIPNYVKGKIFITIDGNNGESGVLNGDAAAEGGVFYHLVLEEVISR
ncbi:MAG TPA: hypothetical protein ENK06_14125 [Gammaproteobacteria bacterium]|nr:hypothetical protein [Gammaproteobacteria bacterium]